MSAFVLKDAYINVNGVVLSGLSNQVVVNDTRDKVDVTGFGAKMKKNAKGLGDGGAKVTFFQDFTGSKVHATLLPLIDSETPVAIKIRPTSAAISATNPEAQFNALLFNYDFLNGGVGAASTTEADFANADDTGIVYAIS